MGKPRGLCCKIGSSDITSEPIYIKQIVDEFKINDLKCWQGNILNLIFKHLIIWLYQQTS